MHHQPFGLEFCMMNESLNDAYLLLKDWTDEERFFLNLKVPEYGLNTKFRDICLF